MIKSIAITTINSILTTILVLLQCVNVAAAQIIPRVEPDTKIYASNPSSQSITVTASYAPMGQNPQNGARQTVTIEPFETVEVPNALSAEGSAYVASSGAEPVLLASVDRAGSGYNAPALPAEAANNRDPQAFILQTGEEKVVILSGNSTSTNTMTFEARGPEGDGYVSSEPLYGPPNIVTSGNINGMLHQVEPPNSSCTTIPQYSDESKAAIVAVYQNPATLDERMQPGQNYSLPNMTPQTYVNMYFGNSVFLNNWEWGSLMRGDAGTRSYAHDVAEILFNHSNPQPPGDVDLWAQILRDEVDGDYANGEVCHSWDPFNFSENFGVRFYESTQNCTKMVEFNMDAKGNQDMTSLLQYDALPSLVDANQSYYGLPDNPKDPTWNKQDPN